jgi:hypothetical protein
LNLLRHVISWLRASWPKNSHRYSYAE